VYRTFRYFVAPVFMVLAAACASSSMQPSVAITESCFIKGLDRELRCLRVSVPLDWAHPSGRKIDIVAAIVPSTSPRSQPDPLIVLAGGPGQGATSYGSLMSTAFREVLKTRDVVLFDQRGTGRSGVLQCQLQNKPWDSIDDATISSAVQRCTDALTKNVQFYSLREVVRDIEALRQAMGYPAINLWGGSYGTLTAQQYIRKYGQYVRAAILDGALAPHHDLLGFVARDAQHAMQSVIDECRRSQECTRHYGDLDAQLNTFVRSLETPRAIRFRDPQTNEPTQAMITRDVAVGLLRGALYTPLSRSLVPHAIVEANRGRFEVLTALGAYTSSWSSDTMAGGVMLTVVCSDQMSFERHEASTLSTGFLGDSYLRVWKAACAKWPHHPMSAEDLTPLRSNVPVLVLSGGLDPVTPPSSGEEVAAQFSNAIHAVMPEGAHNISDVGCAPRLIAHFLVRPGTATLDLSCLRDVQRIPLAPTPVGPSA
jgi:pimeloyl-ACP methyl ester carboxylesterase